MSAAENIGGWKNSVYRIIFLNEHRYYFLRLKYSTRHFSFYPAENI